MRDGALFGKSVEGDALQSKLGVLASVIAPHAFEGAVDFVGGFFEGVEGDADDVIVGHRPRKAHVTAVERDFAPRARMSIQLKDMRNALATADEIGFAAPVTALFEKLYAEGIEHGLSDLDHSGLFVELASRNGMD